MRKYIGIVFLSSILFLSSCESAQKGGGGSVTVESHAVTKQVDGTITTIDSSTIFNAAQPDNPDKPATIKYIQNPDGMITATINSGTGQNIASIEANANLLKIPIYVGIGLIISSLAVGFLTKKIIWAGIIAATGIAMIVGTYLLAQYAVYFLLGFGIILVFGLYLLYDYARQHKANDENVKLINTAKAAGIMDAEKFKQLADNTGIQSKSTKKIVKRIKDKI